MGVVRFDLSPSHPAHAHPPSPFRVVFLCLQSSQLGSGSVSSHPRVPLSELEARLEVLKPEDLRVSAAVGAALLVRVSATGERLSVLRCSCG